MSQNRNADFMILLDPYCLYKEYKEDDKEEIDELFRKILSSVKLSSDNSYITFTYKCANSPRQSPPENLNICEEFFKKEYSLVKPKNIIIFGKYAGDHLFHDQGMQFNNSDNNNKYADSSLFFTYNPVQIFYKPSLKKSVWEYLKIFKKKCGL
ncbi:MAG: hypothetical protein KKH98_06565 [Spirochaetes bacterium]|nr:hypothetical protein [Spirochaetota bacterium]